MKRIFRKYRERKRNLAERKLIDRYLFLMR